MLRDLRFRYGLLLLLVGAILSALDLKVFAPNIVLALAGGSLMGTGLGMIAVSAFIVAIGKVLRGHDSV